MKIEIWVFYSDYSYSPGNIGPDGTYDILKDPSTVHGQATSFKDHTSGNGFMMAVNGSSNSSHIVWQETVSVNQNKTYIFYLGCKLV